MFPSNSIPSSPPSSSFTWCLILIRWKKRADYYTPNSIESSRGVHNFKVVVDPVFIARAASPRLSIRSPYYTTYYPPPPPPLLSDIHPPRVVSLYIGLRTSRVGTKIGYFRRDDNSGIIDSRPRLHTGNTCKIESRQDHRSGSARLTRFLHAISPLAEAVSVKGLTVRVPQGYAV